MENTRREVLIKIRDALVDLFVVFARVIFFWLPGGDIAYGRALMVLHPLAIITIALFFYVIPSNSIMRIFIVCFMIIVIASQWLFSGCVVARAEQRLTGSKETIIDPFLALAGLPADRNTRIAATIATGTTMTVMMAMLVVTDALRANRVL
jgi:hypothetical protein